jgi:hypothetical protein
MKTMIFSKRALLALCLGASLFVASCDKDDDDDDMNNETHTLSGQASGSQEVPAVTTSASGNLSGSYNVNTNKLTYNITWTGLSGIATVAHFHGPAAPGATADPLVDLNITANSAMNGSASATVTLSDAAETALLSGNMYYNIHTALHPTGEIRGQVVTAAN